MQANAEAPVDSDRDKFEKKFLRLQLTPEERSAPVPDIVDQAETSLQGSFDAFAKGAEGR